MRLPRGQWESPIEIATMIKQTFRATNAASDKSNRKSYVCTYVASSIGGNKSKYSWLLSKRDHRNVRTRYRVHDRSVLEQLSLILSEPG